MSTPSGTREGTRIRVPKDFHGVLKEQGISWQVLAEPAFLLEQSVTNISYTAEKMKPQLFKRAEQISDFHKVMAEPFANPYVYVLSGRPSDVQAACVAATLLVQASIAHASAQSVRGSHDYARMGKPRWVKLTNDYRDNTQGMGQRPSMLVFSGITPQASPFKFEKLRDLLEEFDDIPRIVVLNEFCPVQFLNHKLHYKAHYVMQLAHGTKKVEV